MKYDLIVVTQEPFPYGLAATNRMLSYLKGIAKKRAVLFLTYAGPAYGEIANTQQKGIYENIHFRYTGMPYVKRPQNIPAKKFMFLCRVVKLYLLLLFRFRTKSILLYTRDESLIKICRFISSIKGSGLYRDVTETKGIRRTYDSEQSLKKISGCFDGIIVISKGIWDFFDNISDEKKYLLPVLTDPDRFSDINTAKQKYFFCCSGANLERDGLMDILTGFLEFRKTNTEFKLQIASRINEDDAYHLKCKEITDRNTDSIIYLGELPSYHMPRKMTEATALLLTPHNEYATKGFPTKLGEYLMSGTPVICSSIDDLTSILPQDTVLWVKPNSPEEIKHHLQAIAKDPQKFEKTGERGKSWMLENYTYAKYSDSLEDFLGLNRI